MSLLASDPGTFIFLVGCGGPALLFMALLYLSSRRKQSGDASPLADSIPPILGISPTRSRKS